MKKNILYLIMSFCFIFLMNCVGMEIERNVQDNTFYSSGIPQIRVETNPDFTYIGNIHDINEDGKPCDGRWITITGEEEGGT